MCNTYGDYSNYLNTKLRINELFKYKSIKNEKSDFVLSNIIFKKLNFKYNNKQILNNVNLSFKKGDWIMVTGATGSGKSTLFKLLTKQIKTNNIYINNKNINEVLYMDIKNNITYVDQKAKLFSDSIKNNI